MCQGAVVGGGFSSCVVLVAVSSLSFIQALFQRLSFSAGGDFGVHLLLCFGCFKIGLSILALFFQGGIDIARK